jgi:hypothetical protein
VQIVAGLVEFDGRMPADRVGSVEDVGDWICVYAPGFAKVDYARRAAQRFKIGDDGADVRRDTFVCWIGGARRGARRRRAVMLPAVAVEAELLGDIITA